MDDTIAVMLSSVLKKKKKNTTKKHESERKERKEEFLLCLSVLSSLFHHHPVNGRLSATAESLHESIQTTCLLINLQNTQLGTTLYYWTNAEITASYGFFFFFLMFTILLWGRDIMHLQNLGTVF